jgi:hypothetical protein
MRPTSSPLPVSGAKRVDPELVPARDRRPWGILVSAAPDSSAEAAHR